MPAAPPVYLAGPDVFRPDTLELGRAKKAACARHGLEGRFPLDDLELPPDLDDAMTPELARAIFDGCTTMMDGCVAGVANLTPFRGVSADVGTVLELGYLLAQAKPVFGYTSETADYDQRVAPDGLLVESFGLGDNLMIDGALARSGHPLVRVAPSDGEALAALEAFEVCVARAAEVLVHR